jgi:hypothetical protein
VEGEQGPRARALAAQALQSRAEIAIHDWQADPSRAGPTIGVVLAQVEEAVTIRRQLFAADGDPASASALADSCLTTASLRIAASIGQPDEEAVDLIAVAWEMSDLLEGIERQHVRSG